MKTKKIAFAFLIYFILLSLYGLFAWVMFIWESLKYGAEMADSIFLFSLIIGTAYFGSLTIWTYKLYKSQQENKMLQLVIIFVLGIFIPLSLFLSSYFVSRNLTKNFPSGKEITTYGWKYSVKRNEQTVIREYLRATWYLNQWTSYQALTFRDSTIFVDNNIDTVFTLQYSVSHDTLITWSAGSTNKYKNKILNAPNDSLIIIGFREKNDTLIYTRKNTLTNKTAPNSG